MLQNTIILFILAATIPVLSFASDIEQQCIDAATNITEKLDCLVGVKWSEVSAQDIPADVRRFKIQFLQPLNHDNLTEGQFSQQLILNHVDVNAPVVLFTSGYMIFSEQLYPLAKTFGANQLVRSERFFDGSMPNSLDWSKLTIWQAANDAHRITNAFRKIYKKPWIGNGPSKGGMTTLFHSRFFPHDLDGVVAEVSPLTFGSSDSRYITFLNKVGGELYSDCREKFRQYQISLLKNSQKLIPKIEGTFSMLGGADVAFEYSVVESNFYFWQLHKPDDVNSGCSAIPVPTDSLEKHFSFLQEINPIETYTDDELIPYLAYTYQCMTEIGYSGHPIDHLKHLMKYPFDFKKLGPKDVTMNYSETAIRDIESWAKNGADRIIYIYGEFDPWSSTPFPKSESAAETYSFVIPKGNHWVKFYDLPHDDLKQVTEILSRWIGKKPNLSLEKLKTNFQNSNDSKFQRQKSQLRYL